eukprot:TRINITY_DN30332_c0_g1_i1.p1 TRINITY_DN30332_c0_g1~~TRINITY_DN30332_c0_g1_i1.p1  ORF type:complete len:518 (+),score=97.94 TRINITY_DN30332_c0_g1_i1:24-1556(+)
MDAGDTFARACVRAGVAVHPRLHGNFSAYRSVSCVAAEGNVAALRIGSQNVSGDASMAITDGDIVAVCLALRSLSKVRDPGGDVATAHRKRRSPPTVLLDLTGEWLVTCAGAKTIAAFLQVECGLREVILRRTSVGDAGVAALGAALGGSSVSLLDLGECQITDVGVRLLARGLLAHGTPALRLEALLFDGNHLGDEAAVEVIALLDSPLRPPGLATLSLQPSLPSCFSVEGQASLCLACERVGVNLRLPQQSSRLFPTAVAQRLVSQSSGDRGVTQAAVVADTATANIDVGTVAQTPILLRQASTSSIGVVPISCADNFVGSHDVAAVCGGRADAGEVPPCANYAHTMCSAAAATVAGPATAGGASSRQQRRSVTPVKEDITSGQLAAWMANTERELRELKWLMAASITRIDGQHSQLIGELGQLKGDLDNLEKSRDDKTAAGNDEDFNLQLLESRFDALEHLVGTERSECSQMWRLVQAVVADVAASPAGDSTAGASAGGGADAVTAP